MNLDNHHSSKPQIYHQFVLSFYMKLVLGHSHLQQKKLKMMKENGVSLLI